MGHPVGKMDVDTVECRRCETLFVSRLLTVCRLTVCRPYIRNTSFVCQSEIKTDEKSYAGQMQGEEEWGFDWYYERILYRKFDHRHPASCSLDALAAAKAVASVRVMGWSAAFDSR